MTNISLEYNLKNLLLKTLLPVILHQGIDAVTVDPEVEGGALV